MTFALNTNGCPSGNLYPASFLFLIFIFVFVFFSFDLFLNHFVYLYMYLGCQGMSYAAGAWKHSVLLGFGTFSVSAQGSTQPGMIFFSFQFFLLYLLLSLLVFLPL